MKVFEDERTLVVVLEKGDKIIESLKKVANEKKTFGSFAGIGAVSWAEIAYGNAETGEYEIKKYAGGYEVTNLTGNITVDENDNIVIHAHITLGDKDHNAITGHLIEGEISITCEIFIQKTSLKLKRKPIEGTSFKTIREKI